MNVTSQLYNSFQGLQFVEEGHTYSKDGVALTPVSNIVHLFVEPFDIEGIAPLSAAKRGITTEEMIAEWNYIKIKAQVFGTATHLFGENYAIAKFFKKLDPSSFIPSNGHEKAIIKYWNELPSHIVPVYMELQMFSLKWKIAGTADILLYNTITKKLIIADYKTNKDLFKNFQKKTMLAPFTNLLDMPFNHYAIQFSLYQLLLEEKGFEVEDRVLVWLLPDGTYNLYQMKYEGKQLKKYLDENR